MNESACVIAVPFARTKIIQMSISIEIDTFNWTTGHRRKFATKVVVTRFSTD